MQQVKIPIRRLRFWWHLTFAYFARYKLWIAATIFVVLAISYATFAVWPKVLRSNVVTLGYVGSYSLETIPTEVLGLATQSLISADASGKPQPSLASHWTVSEDGKTYIVFLKDNLMWHDGSALDAKDISIAIEGVEISALNNKAIQFRLPNPITSFPLALNKPVFKAKTFYGTGQFRIVDIDKVEDLVKKISMVPRDQNLPRVEINFYQNEKLLKEALKIGEVKRALVSDNSVFANWSNVEIERMIDETEVVTLFYNNSDAMLSSKELRAALSFAINRELFNGQQATGPIPPSNWTYSNNVKKYEYSTARSKELVAKSEIKNPKLTITVTGGLEKVAESIKKDWEAAGVETTLKSEKSVPSDFQILLAINKIEPDPDQYALWHSTQKETNITRLKDVRIDKLLEDARSTKDEQKRKELYADFQKFLVEDAPATFLYHPYKYKITYKNAHHLLSKIEK